MGAMSRRKGQVAERELAALIADLTGWPVRRRVRQHFGDSDLEGVPGWAVECKRHAKATRGLIADWWQQAVDQAQMARARPVLFYRVDRADWRVIWPLATVIAAASDKWLSFEWTVESTVATWAAVARQELVPPVQGEPTVTEPCNEHD